MSKMKIQGIAFGAILVCGTVGWAATAPYAGNTGLSRMPGIILGGTPTAAPSDFSSVDDVGGTLRFQQDGFPPLVIYLTYVGTPEGIITATRPDGGYWAQRIRDGVTDARFRIGDETYEVTAREITGDARLPLLQKYSAKSGMPLDVAVGGPDPLRDWEVFVWTAR